MILLRIVNLLLLGIKARHNSLTQTTTFPVNQQEQEAREQENQFDHFFEMPETSALLKVVILLIALLML